jgi:hypothetical protein
MKSVFAILFSLLLAWTQCAFIPGVAPVVSNPASPCGTSSSCDMPCCARSESPVSQPAVPARALAPSQSHLLLAILSQLIILTPTSSVESSFVSSSSAANAAAVPLYERNCSYLI